MIPHEKALVKRLENEPFMLLGVNTDDETTYRARRVKDGVTWPSFFDGGGRGGPIAKAWNVSGYPTIYILDHEGRIRFKNLRGERMDHAVDTLIAEMKGEAPPPPLEAAEPSGASKGGAVPAVRLGPMQPAKPKGKSIPAIRLGPMTPAKPIKKPDEKSGDADGQKGDQKGGDKGGI